MSALKSKTCHLLSLAVGIVALCAALGAGAACSQVHSEDTAIGRGDLPFHSMESAGRGLSESASIFKAPADVQELVNRSDVVVVATIASISDTASVGPVGSTDTDALVTQGLPEPRILETYYELSVEQVLLDDGVMSTLDGNPKLALSGMHDERSPQTGDRMLFALLAGPDRQIYSLAANWSLIPLNEGSVRNFDGKDPAYPDVTDEATLKSAVAEAAQSHRKSPPSDWPTLFD